MRRPLLLMILCALLSGGVPQVMAMEEAVWGRVVSMDRQAGVMVITPSDGQVPITVRFSPDGLPGSVHEGTRVRVWGEFDPKEARVFHAAVIRGSGWEAGSDPTGVRQRIGGGRLGRGGGFGGRGGGFGGRGRGRGR